MQQRFERTPSRPLWCRAPELGVTLTNAMMPLLVVVVGPRQPISKGGGLCCVGEPVCMVIDPCALAPIVAVE